MTPRWRWRRAWPATVDNFVQLMNRQAQAWGLKNTEFKNVTGTAEPGHKSSARDLSASLPRTSFATSPEYYGYCSATGTYNKIRQDNRNLPLRCDPTVDGLQTGYGEAAGYVLIASSQREFPNGKRRCCPS